MGVVASPGQVVAQPRPVQVSELGSRCDHRYGIELLYEVFQS